MGVAVVLLATTAVGARPTSQHPPPLLLAPAVSGTIVVSTAFWSDCYAKSCMKEQDATAHGGFISLGQWKLES